MAKLPGQILQHDQGAECDDCDGVKAVVTICGETDSFGSEHIHFCQACYDKYKAEAVIPKEEQCDWCKTVTTDCKPFRDWEEGTNGPVYTVCQKCRTDSINSANRECGYLFDSED